MDENKRMHTEARINLIDALLKQVDESRRDGEYYISVNGERMWLSPPEMMTMLGVLRTVVVTSPVLKPYHDSGNQPITID